MLINGIELKQYHLSYDKIIKNILEQSDELTIRFVNGLFGDNIPEGTTVTWLDKESVGDEYRAIVADFYPKIGDRMYAIEVEHYDRGNMALRIFRYAIGGAVQHNLSATDSEIRIVIPQPCVIFLSSKKNTPKKLTWKIEFFDGQRVAVGIPTLRLADLTVDEIARRDLFPVGQFYLRTFEKVDAHNLEEFREAAESLLRKLSEAVSRDKIPVNIGLQMQEIIRRTINNVLIKSKLEGEMAMETNRIMETLPWVDYQEYFKKLEERGKAAGKEEGKAERDMEIANKFITMQYLRMKRKDIIQVLRDLGISEVTIEAAFKNCESACSDTN